MRIDTLKSPTAPAVAWLALVLVTLLAVGCADVVPDAKKFAPGFGGPDVAQDAGDDGGGGGDAVDDSCTQASECEGKVGKADTCRKWACTAGKCAPVVADAQACDDGDSCTENDVCDAAGKCTAGKAKLCDDNNPCTANGCDAGTCKHPDKKDGESCDDGAKCIKGGQCKAGKCDGKPCDDDNPCTDDSCDQAKVECTHTATTKTNVACDDGDPCTAGDTCDGKTCKAGGGDNCKCKKDADCGDNDGNLCSGTTYCDKSKTVWDCAPNPASVPFCSPINDTECQKSACEHTTGKCALVPPAQAVKKCDPQDAKLCWNQWDKTKTTKATCDDGDPCTVNLCDKGQCVIDSYNCGKCTKTSDCKDDGNLCNGVPFCNVAKGACELNPASFVKCPSGNDTECAINTCVEKTTAGNEKVAVCELVATKGSFIKCTDDNPCTVGDTCDGTTCKPGTDTCTCKLDSDCASFDDGNPCNGVYFCDKSGAQPTCKVNPKTIVYCSPADDTDCKANKCDKKTGKCGFVHAAKFSTCNADNNLCTIGDVCDGNGGCDAGTNICDCTKDSDCTGKEDGDECNGTMYCDTKTVPTQCKVNPATIVTCKKDQDTFCNQNLCDKAKGTCAMTAKKDGTACDDGNACNVNEACAGGACKGGTEVCACTKDGDCIDDGDLCNGTQFCDKTSGKGECKNNPATANKGCDTTNDSGCAKTACNKLTGKCELGDDGSCDDKNECTVDACDLTKKSCANTPVGDGTTCTGGTCQAGKCTP